MRAAMDWSYEMLTAAEQTLLRRLSVFAGGWSLAAAEAVCAAPGTPAWPSLVTLVHKSLVVAETLSGRAARYRLLEVVRQYTQDQLRAAHEWSDAHGRLLDAMVTWAEAAAPQLVGPRQQQALDEFDADQAICAWRLIGR